MSEQMSHAHTQLQRPHTDDRGTWRDYWQSLGLEWRTEPEISVERQEELARHRAIIPNIEQGIYPFKGMKLSRADVEWLLATHEGRRGPIIWSDKSQRERHGLDLRGADLRYVDLHGLPLSRMYGGLTRDELSAATEEQCNIAATHLEQSSLYTAHLEGTFLAGAHLEQADLREARLTNADLQGAYLERAILRGVHMEEANLYMAHLESTLLTDAHLEQAFLRRVHLEGANLASANLDRASLRGSHLEQASLIGAHLEQIDAVSAYLDGAVLDAVSLKEANLSNASLKEASLYQADLRGADLQRANLKGANLSMGRLEGTDLRGAFFDSSTNLEGIMLGITFGDTGAGSVSSLADVHWGDVNLSVVDWARLKMLGDEYEVRKRTTWEGKVKDRVTRIKEYQVAVRANRQLAVVLRDQGLGEDASRFAYRAQRLHREVLRRQGKLDAYLFSTFLDLLAGYGFKPIRSILCYLFVILLFTVAYFFTSAASTSHLTWNEALIISITAFHGRGFFPSQFSPTDPLAALAAIEAISGLFTEIIFIVIFTRRFYEK